jgi:hypothetical protein
VTTLAPEPVRECARTIVAYYSSAVISGIVPDAAHLDNGGFHVSINDLRRYGNAGDYSNRQALDVSPPVTVAGRQYAAALDISVGKADMRRMFVAVERVWKNRANDSRAKYVSAINVWSTKDGEAPTRFDFRKGTRTRASRDHEWHEHEDWPRLYVDVHYNAESAYRAGRAQASILTEQTHDQWQRQEQLGPYTPQVNPPKPQPEPDPEDDDDMITSTHQLPSQYAYSSTGEIIAPEHALSIPLPPAGRKDHAWGKDRTLHLSLGADHLTSDARVRIAIHNGKSWSTNVYTLKPGAGARQAVKVPAPATLTAYNITVGRMRPADPGTEPPVAGAEPGPEDIAPSGTIGLLVEIN